MRRRWRASSRWLVTTTRPRTKCKRVQVNLQRGQNVFLSKELLAQVVTPRRWYLKGGSWLRDQNFRGHVEQQFLEVAPAPG